MKKLIAGLLIAGSLSIIFNSIEFDQNTLAYDPPLPPSISLLANDEGIPLSQKRI